VKLLSTNIEAVEPLIEGLDDYSRKAGIARNHIERGSFIAGILERSHDLIPGDISITAIECDRNDNFFYKGTTGNMDSMFSFVKRLEGSGSFSKVEVKYATRKKVKGRELADFNIQCRLKL
jgi:hypothetical protein